MINIILCWCVYILDCLLNVMNLFNKTLDCLIDFYNFLTNDNLLSLSYLFNLIDQNLFDIGQFNNLLFSLFDDFCELVYHFLFSLVQMNNNLFDLGSLRMLNHSDGLFDDSNFVINLSDSSLDNSDLSGDYTFLRNSSGFSLNDEFFNNLGELFDNMFEMSDFLHKLLDNMLFSGAEFLRSHGGSAFKLFHGIFDASHLFGQAFNSMLKMDNLLSDNNLFGS